MQTSANALKVEILYFGRPSDFLMITSERLFVAPEQATLSGVLCLLRKRGERWSYELDERYTYCTINQKVAQADDAVREHDEIRIFSYKSVFEA